MTNFAYVYGTDLNSILADIDDTQLSDFVGLYNTNTNETRITSGQFQLDNGFEMTFRLAGDLEILFGDTIGRTGGPIATIFELVGGNGVSTTIQIDGQITFDIANQEFTRINAPGVANAFGDGSDIVLNGGIAQVTGFGGNDILSGVGGSLSGGDGDDTISFSLTFGPSTRFTQGFGGAGDDTFELYDNRGVAVGGTGDDTFLVASGHVGLFGGEGADAFIFDNASERSETTDNVFAIIRDLDVSEDSVIFADAVGNSFDLRGATQGQTSSFEELFSTDDLSSLSSQRVGDQIFYFGHAADGDARIFRRGTDDQGFEFTEHVRFDGLTLADLDTSQIFVATFDVLDA